MIVICLIASLLLGAPAQEVDLNTAIQKISVEAHGKVGVAVMVVESGQSVAFNGNQHFPMQSVYKFPIGMAVLHQVDAGALKLEQMVAVRKNDFISRAQHSPIRDSHPGGVTLSVRELLRWMVSESDGTASDVLMRLAGGPSAVNQYVRSLGVSGIAIATTEKEMGRDELVQYRNWASPTGMAGLLRALHEGHRLSPPSRSLLLQLMIESVNNGRIKGRLPAGTLVAHKTGSSDTTKGLTPATNDVGIVTLPDGRHLVIAAFVSDSTAADPVRDDVIARIARAAWDYWYP